ncbi:acyl carrier protein [Actinospica durhamensis]|uniref:Acyl carrier protein n=1 Tax=Actinospica durhamensis TaxID=1508375 RepID=A0A941F014_9ACTN|nr:acyl carrier protein [Actinospica durhamensis]MBR7837604.1 acyl carrier protein [Actinospica durhamensis]
MNGPMTYEDLASLMKSRAGTPVEPADLASRSASPFGDFGLDSLGLLGVISELENRYGCSIDGEPEAHKSPGALLALVNDRVSAGA